MPVVNLTRLHQYPITDDPPWALLATHYNGPGEWTAPCPTCGADVTWTQANNTAEPQPPQPHCDTCTPQPAAVPRPAGETLNPIGHLIRVGNTAQRAATGG